MEIVDRKFDYTEIAVKVALEEIAKRDISEDDIKGYKTQQIDKAIKFVRKVIIDDLSLAQKKLFFFVWIPLINLAFKRNFDDDGYILKLRQANYYSLLGFLFFMLCGIASVIYNLPDLTAFAIWILSFLLAYAFDEFYNRQRLISVIKRDFREQGEIAEEEANN